MVLWNRRRPELGYSAAAFTLGWLRLRLFEPVFLFENDTYSQVPIRTVYVVHFIQFEGKRALVQETDICMVLTTL